MYGSLLLLCLALPAQPDAALRDDVQPTGATPAAGARPAAEATAKLTAESKKLVKQLNANSADQRNAAEAALIKLGPIVLEHLPTINRNTPAEVKERLGRVRSVLEKEIATAASQPSRVTLKGEMSLADALQSLEEQTGNRVAPGEQRNGTVTVDLDKVLYWQALDEILDQVGLSIEEYGGEPNTLVLRAKTEDEVSRAEAATYSGVFRFEPIRLESRRDLRNPAVNGLRLTVSVTWEPRIKPISIRQALDSLTMTDDQGDPLSVDSMRAALNASAESGVSAVEMVLPISLPSRDVKAIASLKGKMTAMVPGSVQTFTFDDLQRARDVEIRNAGVSVILEQVRKNVDLYDVYVRIAYDEANNALESHRGWIFNNEAYMLDENGDRIANIGLRGTSQEENAAGVAILFDVQKGLQGHRFVYKTPALILNLPVEFELHNIQLP